MIDEKDKKIITTLQNNARESIRSIAQKTNIRPSTVHKRITKLEKNGTIKGYTTILDPKSVGEGFVVFMFIKGKLDEYLDKKFLSQPCVKDVFGITGEYDLLLKLKFKDVEGFNAFVIKFRKNQRGITSTVTFVATTTLKES